MDDDGRQVVGSADAGAVTSVATASSVAGADSVVEGDLGANGAHDADAASSEVAVGGAASKDVAAGACGGASEADDGVSLPEPPRQILEEQRQLRDMAASPLPSARALLERVLPHVRFPMIKPEQLALMEEDAFVKKYFSSFESYMNNAYKYHAVSKEHRLAAYALRNPCLYHLLITLTRYEPKIFHQLLGRARLSRLATTVRFSEIIPTETFPFTCSLIITGRSE